MVHSFKHNPLQVEYFEKAIRSLLKHPKTYGEKVSVIGQCKGGDLAHGIGSLLPDLVELVVTHGCYLVNPLCSDLTYNDQRFPCNWPAQAWNDRNLFNMDSDGVIHVTTPVPGGDGFCRLFHMENNYMFKIKNDEWMLDKDAFRRSMQVGYPLDQTQKIVHFQTLADPTQAPTPELAKEIAQIALEGSNADLNFINSGHLCTLPTIPMATRSVVPYGENVKAMMEWSRRPQNEKPDEAKECEKLYNGIVQALKQYF